MPDDDYVLGTPIRAKDLERAFRLRFKLGTPEELAELARALEQSQWHDHVTANPDGTCTHAFYPDVDG